MTAAHVESQAADRRAWIVRWMLLWTTHGRSPRITVHDALGLPMAYELHGFEGHLLGDDVRKLFALGVFDRHRVSGRGWVYWLADPVAAKEWVKAWPVPPICDSLEFSKSD